MNYRSKFSLNEDGNSLGINLIRIGKSKLPPGSKKIVNEGIDLQMSKSCFLTFFFSLASKFRLVDAANKSINSLLSEISFINRFLFRPIRTSTFFVV